MQQGLSIRGIARNTGLHTATVRKLLKDHCWSVHPDASDERAGAPSPYEVAVRPQGPVPRRARPQSPPDSLSPEATVWRNHLRDFSLLLLQYRLKVAQVCQVVGVTAETLAIWRRETGVMRVNAPVGHCWLEDHEEDVYSQWLDEEWSLNRLARRYGVSITQLSQFAASRGWPQRRLGKKKDSPPWARVLPLRHDEVRRLWDEGLSASAIGRRMKVTGSAVQSYAKRHGFPHRPNQREQHMELVFQCFQDGLGLRIIAKVLGFTRNFVNGLVRDCGWQRDSPQSVPYPDAM